jgi:predicted tellurium resistance membrane protein TerC
MFEVFAHPEAWISLLTLSLLEIVLGIDNIVFISIVAARLPKERQDEARNIGLGLALLLRIGLLSIISWIAGLTQPLFTLFSLDITGRDLVLIGGGLFLMAKSTMEIHEKLEGEPEDKVAKVYPSFWGVIVQILILDLVFSLDSVITAIGLAKDLIIMIIAVIIAMAVMFVFAKSVSDFVQKHPTMKMLALAFLLMIGLLLFVEGFHVHVEKGYVYFAMAFSLTVELLNLKLRKKTVPVHLKEPVLPDQKS